MIFFISSLTGTYTHLHLNLAFLWGSCEVLDLAYSRHSVSETEQNSIMVMEE